jgi:hypothetical protein
MRCQAQTAAAAALFFSDSNSKVLGCIKGVSKLEVSRERWEDLWQGSV